MTESEARIFLQMQEETDPRDAYDEQFFLLKQFFVSKPIISVTFEAKLDKLNKIEKAAAYFGLQVESEINSIETELKEFDSIKLAFQEYQRLKNELFYKIHAAKTPNEVRFNVLNLLSITRVYNSLWKESPSHKESVILSKEPDPMDLLLAINAAENDEILTFDDLAKKLTTASKQIQIESMRRFMLNKKELE